MKRIIKIEANNIWDYIYNGEDFNIQFRADELDLSESENGVLKIIRDNYLYKLTLKETDKCLFYDIERELVEVKDMLVCDMPEGKMSKKNFYGRVYTFFRVYESEEEEFFVFGSYDETMKVKWFMPTRHDNDDIYYKLIPEETLEKYTMKVENRVTGILLDLSINKSLFEKPNSFSVKTPFKNINVTKREIFLWATRQLDNRRIDYIETDDNQTYRFETYKNDYFDFITYGVNKMSDIDLTGYTFKIKRKRRKERKDGIVKSTAQEEGFGWLKH